MATHQGDFTSNAPAVDGFAITKSDSALLPEVTRAIYVGGGGDVTLKTRHGTTLLFKAVPTGQYLYINAVQVLSTGTSATDLVGLV